MLFWLTLYPWIADRGIGTFHPLLHLRNSRASLRQVFLGKPVASGFHRSSTVTQHDAILHTMAFFQGTLHEGIAAAVQQSKAVVCFVTDGETESKQWEDEFLADQDVVPLLQSAAVTLRMQAGSQEEGYLTQLYPIPKKPTVVVIKNGELKEYVAAGVGKDDFVRRIRQVLQPAQPAQPVQPVPPVTQPTPEVSRVAASPPYQTPSATVGDSGSSTSSGRATPPESNEAQVQSLLAERATRLAAQKKRDEEEARKRRIEKGKAKAEATATSGATDAQSVHAESLKKRQREAREERQRILKAIEDDKAARRARQAEKEAERKAAVEGGGASEKEKETKPEATFAPASPLYSKTGRLSEHCALQVRLFDGSTIRSRFSSSDTLKEVRQWIDETRSDGKTPFLFKILLTPLPSKRVDVTEEGKSLQALGLTPSATLILLPVQKHVSAYDAAPSGGGNVFSRFLAYILGIVSLFFGVLYGFFSTLFSTRGPPQPIASESTRDSRGQGRATGRDGDQVGGVRRPADRRSEQQQQFYNGNSTNFEPRPDDEE